MVSTRQAVLAVVYSLFCSVNIATCAPIESLVSRSAPDNANPIANVGKILSDIDDAVRQTNSAQPDSLKTEAKAFGGPKKANILLFPPILFDSHVFIFTTLGKGLKDLGHKLTLFVSDRRTIEENSPDYSVKRYPGIFSSEEGGEFLQRKLTNILAGKPTFLELFDILGHYSKNCDVIFSEGRASLESLRQEKYDLMIVDPNEMCGFLVARELNIPHIVFSTGMWVPYEASLPSPISYVPEFNSQLSDQMGFFQRIHNAFVYITSRIGTSYLIFPIYDRLITKHRIGFRENERKVYFEEIVRDTQVWLLCTDLALEFPRPTLPHVEYVGGILGRPPKALPEDWQTWADKAENGFIIVSFGAGVKRLNPKLESIFGATLSKLPYPVIWRYPAILQDLGPNIKLVDWLPQNDLLAHRNARLFVGHGGTNGVYECVYHKVPVVGMPLFGDHYDTMTRVQAKGAGVSLNWKSLTESTLEKTILAVASEPKYREAIARLSAIHLDQPYSALERASRKVDYVIRYNGASHLRPAVYDLNLFQYFLVDLVVAFLAAGVAAAWALNVIWTALVGIKEKEAKDERGGSFKTIYDIPKVLGTSALRAGLLILLTVCSGLRFLARHVTFHCGKCTKSSRAFLQCLSVISRQAGRLLSVEEPLAEDVEMGDCHSTSVTWETGSGNRTGLRRNLISDSGRSPARTADSPHPSSIGTPPHCLDEGPSSPTFFLETGCWRPSDAAVEMNHRLNRSFPSDEELDLRGTGGCSTDVKT